MNHQDALLTKNSKRSALIATIVVFGVALIMRLLPWDHVFTNGRIYYYDPDCYMRLRKILVYITSFPKTAIHDYYQGFPKGTGVISPPTMEYFMSAIFFPIRNSELLLQTVTKTVALIPPFLGAVTAVVLTRFVTRINGFSAGLTAGLILAITPAHIEATILGRFDNEMLEPLLLLLAFISYVKTYRECSRLRTWIIAGGLAFLYLSIWRGGIAFLSLIGFDLLLRLWLNRHDKQHLVATGGGAAAMYGVTAILIALVCLTDLWGSRFLFSFNIISWFHVLLFAGAAALFLALTTGLTKSSKTGLLYGIGVVIPLIAALGSEFIAGVSMMGGGNPWIDSIQQYQRNTDPTALIRNFGLVILLLPAAIYLLTQKSWRNLHERRFLIIWCLVMVVATITRQRYAEYLALNSALAAGICASWILTRIRLSGTGASLVVMAMLLIAQIPSFAAINALKEQQVADIFRGDIEETMNWLRENSPSAGDPFRPDQKPAYGVLARWDYGGWIETVAQRPSIATNYGTETFGMNEAAGFFLATNEEEMNAILMRNSIRYIIVDNVMSDLPMYAALLGVTSDVLAMQRDKITGAISYTPTPKLYGLISSRLFFSDGTANTVSNFKFAPVEGVRLQFESTSPADVNGLPWQISKLKVYETVAGARLIVTAAPGTFVKLTQPVETNRSRRFDYRNSKTTDQKGIAEFLISYAPKSNNGTGSVGPVSIEVNGRKRTIEISSNDIDTRKQIRISP